MQQFFFAIYAAHLLLGEVRNMAIDMKKVRELTPNLCEMYDRDSFVVMLKRRGLANMTSYLDAYIHSGWIVPIEVGNKVRFHRGHMLILLRLASINDLHYTAGIENAFDFEDIMSRRAFLCESNAKNVRDDASKIQQLFFWLWSDNASALQPLNAVLAKAIIDLSLDYLDPDGFYENLRIDDGVGTFKLVKDLLAMQSEISEIVSLASSSGLSIPNVQYIFDRKRKYDELSALMLPLQSPFLAVPTRDIMADERLAFIRERNQLLADKKYEELVEFYKSHCYYYESDIACHAALCVCIGHIYGDLIKNSEKAAAAFQEALEYDPANTDAFQEISHHLREAEKWEDLIDLLSNHWDAIDDPQKRCALILECAQIQAFKCQRIRDAIGLYERCAIEGIPGNDFDNLYKIVAGLMEDFTALEKMRVLATLTLHIVNFSQCDKVEALRNKCDVSDDVLGRCFQALIEAGLQSFKGDQPEALDVLCNAITLSPRTNLIDALMYRIASKIHAFNEFQEGVSSLETEAIPSEELSDIWVRIAKVLMRLPNHEMHALEFAEKAVNAYPANNDAIDLCYALAMKDGRLERAFIYATIKAARTKDDKIKEDLESACEEMKLSFEDDEDKLMSAYETLLQFDDVQEDVSRNLRDLMNDLETPKAIDLLQRIETKCISAGMSMFVGELYQCVLERNLSPEQKKSLLERYVGFLLGQDPSKHMDLFVSVHAQLFAMAPSDRLFTMLKQTLKDDTEQLRAWTGLIEDAANHISDSRTLAKIYTTLASCYGEHSLGDLEKEADAYACILRVIPDSVPAFKCCFTAFARLERYFDCTEMCKTFPIEKLSQPERWHYVSKALSFATLRQGDPEAMQFFLTVLAKDNEADIPALLNELVQEAEKDNVDRGQIACFFDIISSNMQGLASVVLKIARANLLALNEANDEVVEILNADLYHEAAAYKVTAFAAPALESLAKSGNDGDLQIVKLWNPELFSAVSAEGECTSEASVKSGSEQTSEVSASIAALVKECAENIGDESFAIVIDNALKTLSSDDATSLCLKLGKLYESNQNLQVAETYYKKAFQYTQSFELLEFYKRVRHFKKALKILSFKLAKAPDSAKNAVKLEMAIVYENMRDFANAIKVMDELIASKSFDKASFIAVLRQKSTCLIQLGDNDTALATLRQASAEADPKTRDEIETDICFLLRETSPDEAKKMQQSLVLRGTVSDKNTLLNACFDMDEGKFTDAEAKLNALIQPDSPMAVSALEQKIRLQQKRGDSDDKIRETALTLSKLAPSNAIAKALLQDAAK